MDDRRHGHHPSGAVAGPAVLVYQPVNGHLAHLRAKGTVTSGTGQYAGFIGRFRSTLRLDLGSGQVTGFAASVVG